MATRYAGDWEFDHGAQFFTARSVDFQAFCAEAAALGLIVPWRARFHDLKRSVVAAERHWNTDFPHYVANHRMNALGKALAGRLDVKFENTVADLRLEKDRWLVLDEDGNACGSFDWVLLAVPAAQAAALAPDDSALRARCQQVEMRPCYALMLGFEAPIDWPFEAAHVADADISWISVNSSKPGRASAASVVVHSTNAWAAANLEANRDEVIAHLLAECEDVVGKHVRSAAHVDLHRWCFANADKQSGDRCFLDPEARLAACGDWFIRGRVEAAWLSGAALAARLEGALG